VNFLNTAVLLGLIAAAIPLILHLFTRTRIKPIPFSTLRFLRQLQHSSIRRLKLRQLLLLLLRTLAIVFLVLGFARPTIRNGSRILPALNAQTSAVVLIDDSPSLSRLGARGVLMQQAIGAAKKIPDLLHSGDDVRLILASDTTLALAERAFHDFNHYLREVEKIETAYQRVNLNAALRFAERQLQRSANLNRELYVLSDFQATALAFPDSESWAQTEMPLLALRFDEQPDINLAVKMIRSSSLLVEPGSVLEMDVEVKNTGRKDLDSRLLQLYVDGDLVAQASATVKSGQTATTALRFVVPASGRYSGRVVAEDDDFNFDNSRYFTLYIPEQLRMLCIATDPQEALFLQLALQAAQNSRQPISCDVHPPAQINHRLLNDSDGIILCNVDRLTSQAVSDLAEAHRSGKGLFFILGDQTDIRFFNSEMADPLRLPRLLKPIEIDPSSRDQLAFGRMDLTHPLFQGLFAAQPSDLATPYFYFGMQMRLTENCDPILNYSSGDPLLVEVKSGEAPILVLATGLRADLTDFYKKTLFAPLMLRIVRYLALQGNEMHQERLVGEPLQHRLQGDHFNSSLTLLRPDGRTDRVYPQLRQDGAWIDYHETKVPGIYFLTVAAEPLASWAVNIDAAESEFASVAKTQYNQIHWITDQKNLPEQLQALRFGQEYWQVMIVIALLFLALEMVIARESNSEQGKV